MTCTLFRMLWSHFLLLLLFPCSLGLGSVEGPAPAQTQQVGARLFAVTLAGGVWPPRPPSLSTGPRGVSPSYRSDSVVLPWACPPLRPGPSQGQPMWSSQLPLAVTWVASL